MRILMLVKIKNTAKRLGPKRPGFFLIETLNLKKSIAQEVKSNIRELSSTLCNRKDDTLGYEKDLLFIPVESYFLNRIVLIVLFGKDNLVYDENYIISNLIKIFESYCLKYLIELDLKETLKMKTV